MAKSPACCKIAFSCGTATNPASPGSHAIAAANEPSSFGIFVRRPAPPQPLILGINQGRSHDEMHNMLVLLKRGQLLDIAFLIMIDVSSLLIVNPFGDFPLNDDWVYARAVKGLVEHGDWRPIGFTGMSLITHSLWGSIFCLPVGFSFNALRLSTITLSIMGMVGVYVLFITNNRGRLLALVAALTFRLQSYIL